MFPVNLPSGKAALSSSLWREPPKVGQYLSSNNETSETYIQIENHLFIRSIIFVQNAISVPSHGDEEMKIFQ